MLNAYHFLPNLCLDFRSFSLPTSQSDSLFVNFAGFVSILDVPYRSGRYLVELSRFVFSTLFLFNAFIACRCRFFFLLHKLGLDVAQGLKSSFEG